MPYFIYDRNQSPFGFPSGEFITSPFIISRSHIKLSWQTIQNVCSLIKLKKVILTFRFNKCQTWKFSKQCFDLPGKCYYYKMLGDARFLFLLISKISLTKIKKLAIPPFESSYVIFHLYSYISITLLHW